MIHAESANDSFTSIHAVSARLANTGIKERNKIIQNRFHISKIKIYRQLEGRNIGMVEIASRISKR
jgi:hypothetical protein